MATEKKRHSVHNDPGSAAVSSGSARLLATRCGNRIYFTIADIPPPSVLSLRPLQARRWSLAKLQNSHPSGAVQLGDKTDSDGVVLISGKRWTVCCLTDALATAKPDCLTAAAEIWSKPEVQGDDQPLQQRRKRRRRTRRRHQQSQRQRRLRPQKQENQVEERELQIQSQQPDGVENMAAAWEQDPECPIKIDSDSGEGCSNNSVNVLPTRTYYTSIRRLRRDRHKFQSSADATIAD